MRAARKFWLRAQSVFVGCYRLLFNLCLMRVLRG